MLFRFLLWAFIFILVFRFIVRFIFPILHITRTAQQKLRQMQDQMNNMQQQQNEPKSAPKVQEGDYIEYEEVK